MDEETEQNRENNAFERVFLKIWFPVVLPPHVARLAIVLQEVSQMPRLSYQPQLARQYDPHIVSFSLFMISLNCLSGVCVIFWWQNIFPIMVEGPKKVSSIYHICQVIIWRRLCKNISRHKSFLAWMRKLSNHRALSLEKVCVILNKVIVNLHTHFNKTWFTLFCRKIWLVAFYTHFLCKIFDQQILPV